MKQCKSLSPTHGLRCRKKRSHTKEEINPTHQCGTLVWAELDPLSDLSQRVGAAQPTLWESAMFKSSLSAAGVSWPMPNTTASGGPGIMHSMCDTPCGPECPPSGVVTAEQELAEWWRGRAEDEIGPTVGKAVEYGSTDLIDIGLMLARTMRRQVNEEEAAELGVFFYLIGKIARWQSSIERGERPSDDTLFDIGVYVRMAQRIRDAGGWPGAARPAGGSTPNTEEQR